MHIDGFNSNECAVTHGIPQGSILGPFLFLVQINDLPNSSNIFKFNLFADDSTVTYSFKRNDISNVRDVVNGELENIYRWLSSNKIKINADKTNFIVFFVQD